jgi:hypothetical protein
MRTLKLILLSLTLFLSQGGYSLSIVCGNLPPLIELQPRFPDPPLIPLDATEDELNKLRMAYDIPLDATEDELNKLRMAYDLIMKEYDLMMVEWEKSEMEYAKWLEEAETGEFDSEGNKHGFWTYRVNDCETESGTYIHGKRQGEWYMDDGIASARSTYKDDKLHGLWKGRWYGRGESGNYKNGKKDGKWTENGGLYGVSHILSEGNYKDGKKDGKWTFWYDHYDQKRKEGNYKDDKRDGKWTFWHLNGQINGAVNYKNDKCVSVDCDLP